MRSIIFYLTVCFVASIAVAEKNACDSVVCRAGRECVDIRGVGECLCVISCADHFRPVCGSDGESYDNHCKLHQHACLTGVHIRVKHKGFCKKVFKTKKEKDAGHASLAKIELQHQIENDLLEDFHRLEKKQALEEKKKHRGPAVCFSSQREALRFLMIKHWEEKLREQPWYTKGMTYRESLWGWFFSCDTSKDSYLNAPELLACSKKVDFFARPEQNEELTKSLCIDAILDDGDVNKDWRLSFEEFTHVMSQTYFPKEKKCSLEGKSYSDEAEVHVECNHCTCALGRWVCTATDCIKDKDGKKKHPKQFFGYADAVDNAIDDEDTKVRDKEPLKNNVDDDTDEEDALELDDYYDDLLFEKTKSKNLRLKKKLELENALKEIKELKKKTEKLNAFWKKQINQEIEDHADGEKFLSKRNFRETKGKLKKHKGKKGLKKQKHLLGFRNNEYRPIKKHHKKWLLKDI